MDVLARRQLRVWALNNVAHCEALTSSARERGSESHPVAGGWLVLSGAGMYVNRAMAIGLDHGLSASDIDQVVRLSRASGVNPTVEVSPETLKDTLSVLKANGFAHVLEADVTALAKWAVDPPITAPEDVLVRPALTKADLLLWQETSAAGWGHASVNARRAADAWAIAANKADDSLLLAFDASDGRPLGCASSTIRDGVATLGGMSTVPVERRRGVQAALLRYRIDLATRHGCDLIATTASSGGASERNLRRHGFVPQFAIQTYAQVPIQREC